MKLIGKLQWKSRTGIADQKEMFEKEGWTRREQEIETAERKIRIYKARSRIVEAAKTINSDLVNIHASVVSGTYVSSVEHLTKQFTYQLSCMIWKKNNGSMKRAKIRYVWNSMLRK